MSQPLRATAGRLVHKVLDRALLPPLPDRATVAPGDLVVGGFLSATLGLGRGARMFEAATRQILGEVHGADVTAVTGHAQVLPRARQQLPARSSGVLLLAVNAPELTRSLRHIGGKLIGERLRIAHWSWELPVLPASWAEALPYVHEVWVPSEFVRSAVEKISDRPVRVVPYPVLAVASSPAPNCAPIRGAAPFRVLTMFDARSSVARKNPFASLHAFISSLGRERGAELIVKCSNIDAAGKAWPRMRELASRYGNIRLLTEALSDVAISELISTCDVLISLHRAEGFGLPLAEAMAAGRAVIATGWSGNMSFMTPSNSVPVDYKLVPIYDPQGIYSGTLGLWAEPDVEMAAAALRALFEDRSRLASLEARAAADAAGLFSGASVWNAWPSDVKNLIC